MAASTCTSLTLLRRVGSSDDAEAWERFVDRYTPRIFLWCKQNRLQDSDAADVTQEVLTKLVTAMGRFQYDATRGTFRAWLRTVTTNTIRDIGRKRKTIQLETSERCAFDQFASSDSVNSLTEAIEQAHREEILEQAGDAVRRRVQPQTWAAYELTSLESLSAAEAAKRIGIKVSEVYVAKSRVIKLLRETVAQIEEQQER
ncbi:MAG: sigma-70 family RNA polymerase sigma factor [Planctomycetota bacterium]